MVTRLAHIWENFLLRFDFHKNNLIMKSWYNESLPLPRRDNPNHDKNFERLYGYRNQIFDKHFDSLDKAEKKELKAATTSDDSLKYESLAVKHVSNLKKELLKFKYVSDVTPGVYHGGLIVLTIHLRSDPGFKNILKDVPYLYHGFQVKIYHEYRYEDNNRKYVENSPDQNETKTEFIHGNIIDIKSDGLVCSGNVYLNMSGGVNGELLSRGGGELQTQLHQYLKNNNIRFVKPGFVIEIGPGKFHFRCIVYSVAINAWYESDTVLVKNTLINTFSILQNKECKTVNVPALATGYGRLKKYDFATALKEALLAKKWNFDKINIVDSNKDGLEILKNAFYKKSESGE